MTPDVQFLLLLAVIALLFITELIPLAVTSIGGAVACGLLGFITILQYSYLPECSSSVQQCSIPGWRRTSGKK